MKILICCSKAFYDKIDSIEKILNQEGHTVILPNSYDNPGRESEIWNLSREQHAKWKGEMYKLSEEKIKECDSMLVLNYEKNGIQNYLGGATFLEMYDAFRHSKPIYMINPIPETMLKDEICGFSPIILNGDLSKLV